MAINDDVTKTYGEWSKDYRDEYNVLDTDAENPRPAKVDRQVVDGNIQDQTVNVSITESYP